MPLMTEDDHPSFPGLPPFPNTVPTAPLLRISLQKLVNGDEAEQDRVWAASRTLGFFYLDLRMDPPSTSTPSASPSPPIDGNAILTTSDTLFTIGTGLFSLPLAEKRAYDHSRSGSYFGYKGLGAATIDASGTTDRNEFYNVAKDQVLGVRSVSDNPDFAYPLYLEQYQDVLGQYMRRCHALVGLLLGVLNQRLGLPEGLLGGLHRIERPAGDQVRWVKAPPQPQGDRRAALGAHTDFGSVTVLLNRLGGLQVRLPRGVEAIAPEEGKGDGVEETVRMCGEEDGERWTYVRPLPGHAVVNLGDALVKFSGGFLRSNVHRVCAPPGEQAECTRYSLVYFARPEDEVLLQPLEESPMIKEKVAGREKEKAMNSKEWILKRALGSRKGVDGWKESRGTENSRLEVSEA